MAIIAHPQTMAGKTLKQQLQTLKDQRNRLIEIEAAWDWMNSRSRMKVSGEKFNQTLARHPATSR